MKDADSKRRTLAQAEKALRDFYDEYPMTSVVTVFGAGVALGASGNTERGLEAAKHVGKKLLENQGTAVIEKIVEGSLGRVLLRTGMSVFYDFLSQLLPKKNSNVAYGSNRSSHYN